MDDFKKQVNRDVCPPGSEHAQAAWLYGQWVYIPWVPGTGPVRPWGGTKEMAEATAKFVGSLLINASEYVLARKPTIDQIPLEMVFSLSPDGSGPFLVGDDKHLLCDDVFSTLDEAAEFISVLQSAYSSDDQI